MGVPGSYFPLGKLPSEFIIGNESILAGGAKCYTQFAGIELNIQPQMVLGLA